MGDHYPYPPEVIRLFSPRFRPDLVRPLVFARGWAQWVKLNQSVEVGE